MKGSYLLLITLPGEQSISIGKRQPWHFPGGYYAYVGSAMGGYQSRLSHHLRSNKKPHWHIDYLLQKAAINGIVLCESDDRTECIIAQALRQRFEAIPGFGASDCRCRSHLFFAIDEMKTTILAILNQLKMKPELAQNLDREAVSTGTRGVKSAR